MKNKYLVTILIVTFILVIIGTCHIAKSQVEILGEILFQNHTFDRIEIFKGQNSVPILVMSNQLENKETVEELYNIQVKKMSKDEDISFMENGGRLLREDLLIIKFYGDNSAIGQLLIWSDGNIYSIDNKSMLLSKRTIAYRCNRLHPEIYAIFRHKIDSIKG